MDYTFKANVKYSKGIEEVFNKLYDFIPWYDQGTSIEYVKHFNANDYIANNFDTFANFVYTDENIKELMNQIIIKVLNVTQNSLDTISKEEYSDLVDKTIAQFSKVRLDGIMVIQYKSYMKAYIDITLYK